MLNDILHNVQFDRVCQKIALPHSPCTLQALSMQPDTSLTWEDTTSSLRNFLKGGETFLFSTSFPLNISFNFIPVYLLMLLSLKSGSECRKIGLNLTLSRMASSAFIQQTTKLFLMQTLILGKLLFAWKCLIVPFCLLCVYPLNLKSDFPFEKFFVAFL